MKIIWQPLSNSRQQEAALIAHGLEERSIQEWFYGDEMPSPEEQNELNASLRLIGSAWVLTR